MLERRGATLEKRDHPRVELGSTVLYSKSIYPKPTIASILDLSLGGAQIESLYSLRKGEDLEMSIVLDQRTMKCRGRVKYAVKQENGSSRAGVQFERLSDHEKLYLRQYLAYLMERGTDI